MAPRGTSVPFSIALAALLSHQALGLRSLSEDCPDAVNLVGKDMCADADTGEKVALACCDEVATCQMDIASATGAIISHLAACQQHCGVVVHVEPDNTVTVVGPEKLCETTCKAAMAQLEPFADPQAIVERCRHVDSDRALQSLQALMPMLRALEAATGECPTTCADPSMRHNGCGYFGIDQTGCEALGCCWDPSSHGTNWCYRTSVEHQCSETCPAPNFDREGRSDCRWLKSTDPDDDVRAQACNDAGCCWDPLEHNSLEPWCFHKPCL
mmetsp:Transcript_26255/g.69690  ORF Transcript_26255/g.69690 Transcript_26255/m.69690 type:complete len:270 (-) Transcript_26255:244-1053(-)